MKRKLFSATLCTLALLLLMGAGIQPSSAAPAIEEESTSAARTEQVLETGISTGTEQNENAQTQDGEEQSSKENEETAAEAEIDAIEIPAMDPDFLIDGQPVHADTTRMWVKSVLYVALKPTVRELAPEAEYHWDSKTKTATVTTSNLTLSAKAGNLYAVANGRYLYIQNTVRMEGDQVYIPLKVLTQAFDAKQSYDAKTDTVQVERGSGAILSGDQFYNKDKLFWLSRVIYAESGNQSLKGKVAVGNVVMNRVKSKKFPNSIVGVLSQKNQFSTYQGGALANRKPNQSSVIAAKLVLDGGVVAETKGALYFDSLVNSWSSRNRTFLCKLGGHNFYR